MIAQQQRHNSRRLLVAASAFCDQQKNIVASMPYRANFQNASANARPWKHMNLLSCSYCPALVFQTDLDHLNYRTYRRSPCTSPLVAGRLSSAQNNDADNGHNQDEEEETRLWAYSWFRPARNSRHSSGGCRRSTGVFSNDQNLSSGSL